MSPQPEIAASSPVTAESGRRRAVWAAFVKRVAERHPTLVSFGNVLSASLVARALTVAKGLVVAKLVAPEIYGVSGAVSIILAYAQYADLGTATAASRDMTSAIGRGDDQETRRSAAWLGSLKLASIIIVALGALAFSLWPGLDASLRLGLTVLPAIALPTAMLTVILLQWQAHSRIKEFSRATRIAAAADFMLGVALTWMWGLPGLLAAAAIAPAITLVWSVTRGHIVWPSLPPLSVVRRYGVVGAPLIALALIDHNLIYIDQLIVLRYFTLHELGVYNIAMIATEAVRMIGIATGVVIGPRLIRDLARAGGKVETIEKLTLRPVELHACIVPFAVAGLWLAGSYFIVRFYPRYVETVRPMQVLLLAFYFLVVNGGVTTFLFAINKHRRNLLILVPALVFNVVIDIALIRAGWGLLAVATGSLATYILYSLVHLSYVASHFGLARAQWMRLYAGVFLPPVYLALIMTAIERLFDYHASLLSAALACLVAALLLSPLAVRGLSIARSLEAASPGDA